MPTHMHLSRHAVPRCCVGGPQEPQQTPPPQQAPYYKPIQRKQRRLTPSERYGAAILALKSRVSSAQKVLGSADRYIAHRFLRKWQDWWGPAPRVRMRTKLDDRQREQVHCTGQSSVRHVGTQVRQHTAVRLRAALPATLLLSVWWTFSQRVRPSAVLITLVTAGLVTNQ